MKTTKTAVYMTADPLNANDIQLLKETKKTFVNFDIVLDRKGFKSNFNLSYSDRVDILKHDLSKLKITDYDIILNDGSLNTTIKKHNIKTLVVGVNHDTADKMLKKAKYIGKVNDVSIVAIPTFSSASPDLLKFLLDESIDKNLQSKYLSDYAFMKTKLKNIHKIGLAYEDKQQMLIVLKALADKEQEFEIIDLDQFKTTEIMSELDKKLRNCLKPNLVFVSSKLFENQFNKMCDDVVCVYSNKLSTEQKDWMSQSIMYVDATGNDESTYRNAINLVNHRIL